MTFGRKDFLPVEPASRLSFLFLQRRTLANLLRLSRNSFATLCFKVLILSDIHPNLAIRENNEWKAPCGSEVWFNSARQEAQILN